jgi:bifunctional UDP-N-acetylglucosamine pyrophosphorylase/glucosamine-1-phosphate N-acetyltransferase/UDP-N-acetylglucosamine pyrophosphorylase
LLVALKSLGNNNAQREYYITDCPAILRGQGREVRAKAVLQPVESLSINTPEELKIVEQVILDGPQSAAGSQAR